MSTRDQALPPAAGRDWTARVNASAENGFTLIELLVAMVILAIAVPAITNMLVSMASGGNVIVTDSTLQTQARAAADQIVVELRQAYTAQPSVPPIITMGATQLTFYTPDEQTPFHLLKVGYRVSGGNLQRATETSTNTNGPPWVWPTPDTLGPWITVASSITNANLFAFQRPDGSTSPDTAHVSRVVITLQTTRTGRGGLVETYATSATIRGSQVTS